MIQRYVFTQRSTNIAAGVYNDSANVDLTAKFNVILNFAALSAYFYDSVTQQGIVGAAVVNMRPGAVWTVRDNPAFSGATYVPTMSASPEGTFSIPLYQYMNTGEIVQISFSIFLQTVTANPITVKVTNMLGYICPEDYLSVEPFDI